MEGHWSQAMDGSKERLHLKGFLSEDVCKELEFIHKSCGVVGYRPSVLSTTLSHLIATNSAALIIPFLPIRNKVKELVEHQFGCEYELVVEFTGLISWTKGSRIGWHSDDNRPYLKQRHFTAVCYLSDYGIDFNGGLFHFAKDYPSTIIPSRGDVLIYRAEEVHSVDEIVEGERCTLALWFSRDSSHDEDIKLLEQISQILPNTRLGLEIEEGINYFLSATKRTEKNNKIGEEFLLKGTENANNQHGPSSSLSFVIPISASDSMYWIESQEGEQERENSTKIAQCTESKQGYDIRLARLASLCLEIYNYSINQSAATFPTSSSCPNSDICNLEKPVMLCSKERQIPYVFSNSIHALQVLFFSKWKLKDGEYRQSEVKSPRRYGSQQADCKTDYVRNGMTKAYENMEKVNFVDAKTSCLLIHEWNFYMLKQWKTLLESFPAWKITKSLSVD